MFVPIFNVTPVIATLIMDQVTLMLFGKFPIIHQNNYLIIEVDGGKTFDHCVTNIEKIRKSCVKN